MDLHIICIDDDVDFLNLIKAILTRRLEKNKTDGVTSKQNPNMNYHFKFIDEPLKALSHIKQMQDNNEEPAMVIVDYNMPEMTGIEFLFKLNPIVTDTIKVLLTGDDQLESAIKAINNNLLDKYLKKPIKDKEDFVISIRNMLKRYTMKKQLDSKTLQLIQADKMASVGIMAAGVAHEINNPLNVSIGDIHLLKRDVFDISDFVRQLPIKYLPPDILKSFENLKKEKDIDYIVGNVEKKLSRLNNGLKRIQVIIKQLREFAHLDVGEVTVLDINKNIDITMNMIPKEYFKDIKIVKNFATLPLVKCNGRQLNQVFMNIMKNAFFAMESKGQFIITTSSDDNHTYIKFCDSGSGIPEEKISFVFDPFYTTKPVGSGTGLGLSTSYSIMEKQGGDISVSNNVDKGVTFTVKLLTDGANITN